MSYLTTSDGTSIFYRDLGSGSPVLFLSASTLSSIQWQYTTHHLAERGLRCVAYDRRGHGRSDDPGRGYDYDTLAADLAAVIDHLDLRDLTLVGHSMGGGEIVRYLTRFGADRVARVVLVAATVPFLLRTPDNPDGVAGEIFEKAREPWHSDYPGWLTGGSGQYFGAGLPGCSVSQELQQWTRGDILSTSLQAVFECNRTVVGTDFRDELRQVTVPALIIHGDADANVPLNLTSARTAHLIPTARLLTYQNAPHALYLTHRERLDDDLIAFITA
jgi:non-heme chloroperoxidase